jgi:hypothetical protein
VLLATHHFEHQTAVPHVASRLRLLLAHALPVLRIAMQAGSMCQAQCGCCKVSERARAADAAASRTSKARRGKLQMQLAEMPETT